MKLFSTFFISLFACTVVVFADPNGKAGRLLNNVGCGDCHGNISSATTVTMTSKSGSFTIAPGGKLELTAVVAHTSKPSSGINLGVKESSTSNTNAGTLEVITGQYLKKSGSELTQSSPKPMTNGKAEYSFNWIAPTKTGTYYLLAVGNAVNGNGREDSGDNWNYMTPIAITVTTSTGIEEANTIADFSIFPNPVVNEGTLKFSLKNADNVSVEFSDILGKTLLQYSLGDLPEGNHSISLHDNIAVLNSGHYFITLRTLASAKSLPLIIKK